METALTNRLELELNSAARERALADETMAHGRTLPTLSATTQYSCGYRPGNLPADQPAGVDGYRYTGFYAGLMANWNIFDGTLSKIEAESARARALKSSTDKEVTKKRISKEVKKIHSDLKMTQKRTRALQAQLKSTQETFRLTDNQNKVGIVTDADLQTSDAKNYATQFACLGQVVTFQRSLFALNAACGYALDTLEAPEIIEIIETV